jgi:hypothetical protein
LTLFEAYDYLVVGSFLKDPERPIWVICSESHYSVLFADPSSSSTSTATIDLFYFDGLANQDEEIRLSIDPNGVEAPREKARHDDQTLTPPLNLVIQTKWPRATIDWHGVEPLL